MDDRTHRAGLAEGVLVTGAVVEEPSGRQTHCRLPIQDYGSLVSLVKFSAVGNLMGSVMGTVKMEGWLARMFYVSLYRMHQMALYGMFRIGLLMLSDRIGRRTHPRMKLH